jgi:hypothetical protein
LTQIVEEMQRLKGDSRRGMRRRMLLAGERWPASRRTGISLN